MEEAGVDPAVIAVALGNIARAHGMVQLAKETGLTREGLYKALSAEGNPSLGTVLKVLKAFGLKLTPHVAWTIAPNPRRHCANAKTHEAAAWLPRKIDHACQHKPPQNPSRGSSKRIMATIRTNGRGRYSESALFLRLAHATATAALSCSNNRRNCSAGTGRQK